VDGLTKTVALEVAKDNISVNTIAAAVSTVTRDKVQVLAAVAYPSYPN
jgi:NAD(P)-dependent dehydrogenase (short-subunit alcohol dehydrogenase family)